MTDEKISTPPSFTISGFNPEQTITAAVTIGDDGEIAQIHAENTSQWQPIETAPKDGREVILFWPYITQEGYVTAGHWQKTFAPGVDDYWYSSSVNSGATPPTHWQPLPPPPGEEE